MTQQPQADPLYLGIDVGSVSINLALVRPDRSVAWTRYLRHFGRSMQVVREALESLLAEISPDSIRGVAATGAGGNLLAELLDARAVNEVVAQSKATAHLHPEARTIVEIGGEDSKLIFLGTEAEGEIADFNMNTICAAGTGSFLDQQASRLGLTIEEFGALAARSEHVPRVAGRCSVFAKSDMIHLQQKGTQPHDIVAGLCFAMARNFKSTVGSARKLEAPVAFQGGVAANPGMARAFREVLELEDSELIIPEHFAATGAIGATYALLESGDDGSPFNGAWAGKLDAFLAEQQARPIIRTLPPLKLDESRFGAVDGQVFRPPAGRRIPAYLGVDVGSISTNVVVLDENRRLLAKRYLMTAGRPIEAVRQGLREVGGEVADRVEIRGACTTGSGRYLIADFIGADVVKNEITAQARAAAEIDPQVDTIFEIGGQDSKFIRLENSAVVDFEMNKVCAAGTGSFLEEQAEKLGLNIKEEFGRLALASTAPAALGERCTVFMETELVRHQQSGRPTADLVAGLSYSIVYNYLNRVVAGKKVGDRIFFQGGVAANRGVAAAFEAVTGKPITVPPHYEVTGAIGCALIAMENDTGVGSRFKGFDLSERRYEVSSFECKDCPNHCEINRVTVEGERPRFYGSRCEKYDVERRAKKGEHLPDLFAEREKLLLNSYRPAKELPAGAKRVGMPRSLLFHDLYPLWHAFFREVGFEVVLSDATTKHTIHRGVEGSVVETCFPMKLGLGHVLSLLEKDIDYLFLPSVINMPRSDNAFTDSFVCPYVQSFPYTLRSAVELGQNGVRPLSPVIWLHLGRNHLRYVMRKLGRELGLSAARVDKAATAGLAAIAEFQAATEQRGQEVLAGLGPEDRALVIVSRSYNGCDSGANLDLPRKLRDMGVLAIPMDFLPLDSVKVSGQWPNMYWRYGQKIMAAAEIIAADPRLTAVYLTNFGCGPDSFLTRFFRERMGEKPFLQIEVDEHSADAGLITRAEAFLDSLEGAKHRRVGTGAPVRTVSLTKGSKRTVLIPSMADHAYGLAAACEASGMPAEVLPEADDESLYWGRLFTTGKECFPCIVTTGDMVKRVKQPDFDRNRYAFFMGGSGGPCRFGQYNALQRIVLDELGYEDVPLWAPNQAASFYNDLGLLGRKFLWRGWQSIVAIDMLFKALREIKPYEVDSGEAERVYRKYLEEVCEAIRRDEPLAPVMRRAAAAFGDIETDRSEPKPMIGLVGEIFVRAHRFSNNNLIAEVERLGGEVWMAPVYEWFLYRNFRRGMRSRLDRDWGLWAKNWIKDRVMKRDEQKLSAPFAGLLRSAHEPHTLEVLDMCAPYLHRSFEGEAILTVGKAIDFTRKGLDGVISAMPFTCMPGTISHAILKRVKEAEGNFPFLNMVYDGTEQANTATRLEAFLHQAREHRRRRRE
jgi:predicted CoA-substrate-specific enzyme activase